MQRKIQGLPVKYYIPQSLGTTSNTLQLDLKVAETICVNQGSIHPAILGIPSDDFGILLYSAMCTKGVGMS